MAEAVQIELNSVRQFDPHGDPTKIGQSWRRWLRSFELFAKGKGVTGVDQKRALLLHCAGPDVQDIFDTLEEKEGTDEYEKLVKTLNDQFTPKSNVAFERHCFRTMYQNENETVDQYIVRLRRQAVLCDFDKPEDHSLPLSLLKKGSCVLNYLR